MQWVGRALSSVSQYYKEINPATLSGAIDIIVVERRNDDGQTELACSPFHVRFGKLSVLRPVDRKVTVHVNGTEAPFCMKVGDTGEAFFVFETDDDVPEDLQTSPLSRPIAEEDIPLTQEPDAFELDKSEARPNPVNNVAEKTQGVGKAAISALTRSGKLTKSTPPNHKDKNAKTNEVGQLEESMRNDLQGMSLKDAEKLKLSPDERLGHEVRVAASKRSSQDSLSTSSLQSSLKPDALKFVPNDSASAAATHDPTTPMNELMLDMSGYKMEDIEADMAETPTLEETLNDRFEPSADSGAPPTGSEDDTVALTRALLRSAEVQSQGTDSSDHITADVEQQPPLRASSPEPEEIQDAPLPGPVGSVRSPEPYQFSLRVERVLYAFELSLCGSNTFTNDDARIWENSDSFKQHRISFEDFIKQPDLTNDKRLVIKYNGKYLTWDNASPLLASLGIYRQSLDKSSSVHANDSATNNKAPRTWSRWFGRSPPPENNPDKIAADEMVLPVQAQEPAPVVKAHALPQDLVGEQPKDNHHYAKTLRLTSDQLKTLNLRKGMNTISFTVVSSFSGVAVCSSRVFLWDEDYSVVISDIDGTITKSDALGHVLTMIGRDWTHLGVAKLYTDIARNGYKVMYLTSRAIGQADTTREYLKGIQQNNFQLPDGPVIMSPDRLMTSLHRFAL